MNKTSYFPSTYHRNVFIIMLVFMLFLVTLKKCWVKDIDNFGTNNFHTLSTNNLILHDNLMFFPTDTTKQKVQYFLKLPYTQDQFRKKIDTIYQVTMQLGKSMTVDQSEQLKGFVLSVIGRLSNDAKIDSTKK